MLTRNKNATEKVSGTKTESAKLSCSSSVFEENKPSIKTGEIIVNEVIKGEDKLTLILSKLNDVCTDIHGIRTSIDNIEQRISKVTYKVENMERVVNQHTNDILMTNFTIDTLEQYARRNNLRFFGLAEKPSENIDNIILQVIKEKMNIDINIHDIERAHRIGKKTASNTRPIIVKFVSYRTRATVFQARRLLKGQKIYIQEDLTKYRHSLMLKATTVFGRERVWSRDGRIFWLEVRENGEMARCTKEIGQLEAYLKTLGVEK